MNRFENDVYIEGISTVLGQSKDLTEAVKANEYSAYILQNWLSTL